ncbi:MAG TPA: hypothetical protein VEF90_11060, partial [Xanthobacteraceae bacterium]|nr:hypothetical protein [Xanthobacteraceae bacterium]
MGLAGKIGSVVKFGLAVAMVLSVSGAGHYRAVAQQPADEARQAPQPAGPRYQTCLNNADAAHDAAVADNCKSLAEKTAVDRADCLDKLKLPKTYCEASYGARDASP